MQLLVRELAKGKIPGHDIFDLTSQVAGQITESDLLCSETQNEYHPQNNTDALFNVLLPTVDTREAMIMQDRGSGEVTDWQLSRVVSDTQCDCGKSVHAHHHHSPVTESVGNDLNRVAELLSFLSLCTHSSLHEEPGCKVKYLIRNRTSTGRMLTN